MKRHCHLAVLAFCLGWVVPVVGQFYQPMIVDASLLKFFPSDAAFSATVEILSHTPKYRCPVRIAVREGMARLEMDISRMDQSGQSKLMEEYYRSMQKAGSAEAITISNPQAKAVFTILPRLKIYTEDAIPADALSQLSERPVARRVDLGTETMSGRTCTKTRLTFSRGVMDIWRTWETPEAIVWTTKDAPRTLVRMEVLNSLGQTNASLAFSQVDLHKPDLALFLVPAGFEKCDQASLLKRIMDQWPK